MFKCSRLTLKTQMFQIDQQFLLIGPYSRILKFYWIFLFYFISYNPGACVHFCFVSCLCTRCLLKSQDQAYARAQRQCGGLWSAKKADQSEPRTLWLADFLRSHNITGLLELTDLFTYDLVSLLHSTCLSDCNSDDLIVGWRGHKILIKLTDLLIYFL